MLYYNDENLMFASLASNRRQTVFRLRADLLDRMRVKAKKENRADNLTKVDMSVVFQKVCPEPVPLGFIDSPACAIQATLMTDKVRRLYRYNLPFIFGH